MYQIFVEKIDIPFVGIRAYIHNYMINIYKIV